VEGGAAVSEGGRLAVRSQRCRSCSLSMEAGFPRIPGISDAPWGASRARQASFPFSVFSCHWSLVIGRGSLAGGGKPVVITDHQGQLTQET
jgi:hypothetical protein